MNLKIMKSLIWIRNKIENWCWNNKTGKFRLFGFTIHLSNWMDWLIANWPWCPHDWEIDQCGYVHHQYCLLCYKSRYPKIGKLRHHEYEEWLKENPNTPLE
jgi:uncharacterized protein YggL (DUF469 family)